jgi:hypothetical protein
MTFPATILFDQHKKYLQLDNCLGITKVQLEIVEYIDFDWMELTESRMTTF